MTWLRIKAILKKIWIWAKNHGELLLGILIATTVFLFISRGKKPLDIAKIIETFREKHKKDVDAVENAYKESLARQESAANRMADTIIAVEEKSRQSERELTQQKEREIEKVIEESKGDAGAITRKISELTGITVVERIDD